MRVDQVIRALSQHRHGQQVQATTPHGTFTFQVVAVEGTVVDGPVLRLVEDVQVRLADERAAKDNEQWWRNR